ncbi:hypothetical protein SAMN05661008_01148 [Alkalithermobacter thermoalcaliphilus JW-YL-7 = DSM 7308]|uniref:Uncharacterized protein n=1 Tax=Alkalithermobacter thermoalcaliphilus JW-YL-7 = DSM 7308 TaxID=1121328 RepID=A0A150FNE6_CLOPD|nr:hypothetical protein JWYL7_0234 [[Clostridium] paradoxum JW-YL-7 = DSM 7308]SHK92462.1 hypothetical protein SAMN05661008_01148 [[Clostridium] paradoxum JW-YL-7 = DSM 7308]
MYYGQNPNPLNIVRYYYSLLRPNRNFEREYEDILRQGVDDIDKIINEIEKKHSYLYSEVSKTGLSSAVMRVLMRFVVRYVVDNANKYKGTIRQRATNILNDLRREHAWIFFVLRAYGIAPRLIDQVMLEIISFVLVYLETSSHIPNEIERKANIILNLIRDNTSVFNDLRNYGIPQRRIEHIVKGIIVFTLMNIDPSDIYTNMEEKVRNILLKIQQDNIDEFKELQSYKIPISQIRAILRTIIRFTIEHVEQVDQHLEREAIRITNLIRNTTNIFTVLRSFGIPQRDIPQIVKDIVYYTLQKSHLVKPYSNIQTQANEILTEMINTNHPVIRTLRSYGIKINDIKPVLRRIIVFTLRNKT